MRRPRLTDWLDPHDIDSWGHLVTVLGVLALGAMAVWVVVR